MRRRKDDVIALSKMELLADLQVHQAELEMQNQELREAQQQLEESRNHYIDLFDYAPVGYLTLDKSGHIQSINLTGAFLLGKERSILIGKPFTACFVQIDQQGFYHFLMDIFNHPGANHTYELKTRNAHNQLSSFLLDCIVSDDNNTCRVTLSDISQFRETFDINTELLATNRRLVKELFRVQENERRTLAHELHDELGQWLTAILAENEVILHSAKKDSIVITSAKAIRDCIQRMHDLISSMLQQLRPTLLDTLGLPKALLELRKKWCSHHQNIALELKFEGELSIFDEEMNITVFRLVQEGLNNICSHSEATWARISLTHENIESSPVGCLQLEVQDNGKGYDVNQQFTGLGLLGMRERVIAMNGTLSVHSVPNKGTEITIRIPIERSKND